MWIIAPNKKVLFIGAAVALAVCGIILLSYVRSQIAAPGVPRESLDFFAMIKRLPTGTRDILAQWSAWVSPAAFSRYYFDSNYLDIWQRGFGISGVWSYIFTSVYLFQIFWAVAIVGLPIYLAKRGSVLKTCKKSIVIVVAVGLAAHFSMSLIKDATTHPHYFQAIWWIPFVLVAIALDYLKSSRAKIYKMVLGCITVVVVCNFLFLSTLASMLNLYEGFEGSGFGPTVSAQKDMMKSLCARDTPSLTFRRESKVFFESNVKWWGGALEECKTKEFLFSSSEGIDFNFNFADRPVFTAEN